jgi:hypothetical protein
MFISLKQNRLSRLTDIKESSRSNPRYKSRMGFETLVLLETMIRAPSKNVAWAVVVGGIV